MDTVTLLKNTTTVEDCEDAWTAGANVTASLEATIFQRGAGSAKLLVDAAAGASQILGYENFTAKDLTNYTHIAFWIYSTKALASADLEFHISETNAIGGTPIEMTIPAIPIDAWRRVLLEIPAGSKDAILSCGVYQNTDLAGFSLYIDDVIACTPKEFEILDIVGMPEMEQSEGFPGDLVVELLDGTIDIKRSRTRRIVTVNFMNMDSYGDLTWLHDALMYYSSVRILYAETSTANVFEDECEGVYEGRVFAPARMSGVEFLKGGGPLTFREKHAQWSASRRPPSVTVPS